MSEVLPEKIGIIGGGQLGRMDVQAGIPLGLRFKVLEEKAGCPAALAGAEQIVAPRNSEEAIIELATWADVLTIELDHVNGPFLAKLPELGIDVDMHPRADTIVWVQDKLTQKEKLKASGIPVVDFRDMASYAPSYNSHNPGWFPNGHVIKARKGGFDGRSNLVLGSLAGQWGKIKKEFGDRPIYAEERVDFARELSFVAARSKDGNVKAYPVVETIHKNSICHEVMAPAQGNPKEIARAFDLGWETFKLLEGAGVFCVEMFDLGDSNFAANEIALRVHNSGHWTKRGAETSQFEQHVRGIAGLPLGSAAMKYEVAVMMNILGREEGPLTRRGMDKALAMHGVYIDLYGKTPAPERKIGDIIVVGNDMAVARAKAAKARELIED